MIEAHKVKTLQSLFNPIQDNVDYIARTMQSNSPSVEDVKNMDFYMSILLEQVVLWRANCINFFEEKEGVKIRE